MLTIAWFLLTPVVWLLGTGLIFDKDKQDYGSSSAVAVVLFVMPFWAVYCLIRYIVDGLSL